MELESWERLGKGNMEFKKSLSGDVENNSATDAGRTFDLLYKPGFAVEMRVFGLRKGDIASGWYDDRDAFVRDVLEQDASGRDTCYATLNPAHPDLLARSYNTLNRGESTADKNVERFKTLLVDFDPRRVADIPSTDAEKRAAYDKLREARTYLLSLGFPEPVIADSANGYHLLFRTDLPSDDVKLVRRFLEALNGRFGDAVVGIDTSVHNPSRITKVYGTTPRNKGTGTKDRPVRASRLLDVPEELYEVSRDLLLEVAGDEPQVTKDEPKGYRLQDGGKFDIPAFIERHGIEVLKEDEWDGPDLWEGSSKWIVECPWNGHTDNACHIIQNPEGVISARCKHDSCQGKDWRDFRQHFEPSLPFPFLKDSNGNDSTDLDDDDEFISSIVDVAESTRPRGEQPYLVAGVLPERYPTVFFGDSGSMKSILTEHLEQCVARGIPWMGHATKRTNVLTLDFELDTNTHNRRAHDVAKGMGFRQPSPGSYYKECAGIAPKRAMSAALRACKRLNIGLLIIDSLGVALEGDAEAARDVIGFMRNHVDQFRAAGITTLIIDHQGKLQSGEKYQGKTQFGSAYKKHLSRSVFQLEKREGTEDESRVTFRQTKTNFGRELDPFGVKVTWGFENIAIEPEELSQADLAAEGTVNVSTRILIALQDGPKFPRELAEELDAEPSTIKSRLTGLRSAGKIEDTGLTENRSRQVRLVALPLPPLSNGNGNDKPPASVSGIPNTIKDRDASGLYRTLREFYPDLAFSPQRVAEIVGPFLEDHSDQVEAFAAATGSDNPHAWKEAAARELLAGKAT